MWRRLQRLPLNTARFGGRVVGEFISGIAGPVFQPVGRMIEGAANFVGITFFGLLGAGAVVAAGSIAYDKYKKTKISDE